MELSSAARWSTQTGPTFLSGLDALLLGEPDTNSEDITTTSNRGVRRGDIIEIQGVTASGKSTLLLFLAATAILPTRVDGGARVGGKHQTVVWVECGTSVGPDVDRLRLLCKTHLTTMLPRKTPQQVDELVNQSLDRFTVFRPTTTAQLAQVVHDLPQWFMQQGKDEIGYLMM